MKFLLNFVIIAGALAAAFASKDINNDKDFSKQVADAKPGAVIMAPSGRVLTLKIMKRAYFPRITITGGTFSKVELIDTTGVTLDRSIIRRSDVSDVSPLISLRGTSGISITNATVIGNSLAVGVSMRNDRNVQITHGSFSGLSNGIRGLGVDGLVLKGNRLRLIGIDGIGLGGISNAQIDDNDIDYTSNWKPKSDSGHPDAIQIWDTLDSLNRNISIRNNLISVFGQGVFVKSENHGGFENVVISGNDVRADFSNGLTLTNSRNSFFSGNTVRTRSGTVNMAKIILIKNRRLTFLNSKTCKLGDTDNEFLLKRGITLNWQCPTMLSKNMISDL